MIYLKGSSYHNWLLNDISKYEEVHAEPIYLLLLPLWVKKHLFIK